jgi:hypothetical protein
LLVQKIFFTEYHTCSYEAADQGRASRERRGGNSRDPSHGRNPPPLSVADPGSGSFMTPLELVSGFGIWDGKKIGSRIIFPRA